MRSINQASSRLIVRLDFDSNFRNRLNPTILTLGINSKLESISIILKSNRIAKKSKITLLCQELLILYFFLLIK